MHIHNLNKWKHNHRFHITNSKGERGTKQVILLTAAMMIIEIVAGTIYNSMALLADGWHMGTHAAALGITVFAYSYARRNADNPKYSFGTGKVSDLGGFASAIVLAVVALLMAAESLHRFFTPKTIQFNEAIFVAVVGLAVNLVSAFILQGGTHHGHNHDHKHHQDQNLRAAYLHVLADAMTSVLAIVALLAGKTFGWVWMDPMMGIVGAVIILLWSYGLLRDTSKVLLDSEVEQKTVAAIRATLEADSDNKVSDLHIWRISSRHLAAIISLVTHQPKAPEYYKKLLADFKELSHISIEVHGAPGDPCEGEFN